MNSSVASVVVVAIVIAMAVLAVWRCRKKGVPCSCGCSDKAKSQGCGGKCGCCG